MNILIAGDSWGCGQWGDDGARGFVTIDPTYARRLSHIHGMTVANIAHGGAANDMMQFLLMSFLRANTTQWDVVYFFQSDPFRSQVFADITKTPSLSALADDHLNMLYGNLNELQCKHRVPIRLVGGSSDVDVGHAARWGVGTAMPSITQFLLPAHTPTRYHYTDDVFIALGERIDASKRSDLKAEWCAIHDIVMTKSDFWENNPTYFYPDAVHPNRVGCEKVADALALDAIRVRENRV